MDENGKSKLIEWGEELPKGKQLRNGKWDFSEAQDEAYGRVEDFIKDNDFDKFENNNSNTPKDDEKPEKENKVFADEDDEDLPF